MALHARIIGTETETPGFEIDVHGFYASLVLWSKGVISKAQIVSAYALSTQDESDLDFLKAQYDLAADKGVFMVGLEALMIAADGRRYGLEVQSSFVAAVQALK